MSNLSTIQITTIQEFRAAHPGPIGIILEDAQGYFSLIQHLTGEPVGHWDQLAELKQRRVVWCINGTGGGLPGFPAQENLRELTQSYRWCFVLFHGTFGRDAIASQMDRLLTDGQQCDRLVFVNYHLDDSEAKDDLRRLFSMIPTVKLYFPDAQHLYEIDSEYVNPRGAKQVARLFEHLRKVGLPLFAVSYREFRSAVEAIGSQDSASAVSATVREQLAEATDTLFEINATSLGSKDEFWKRVGRACKAFLAVKEGK